MDNGKLKIDNEKKKRNLNHRIHGKHRIF